MQPQAAMQPIQPVSEDRSSTMMMASNMLFYSGLATLAVGAGMALRSSSTSTPSQRAMELSEALTVDAELGVAQRTVAPVMMAEEGPRAPWPGKGDEPLSWGKGFIKEGAKGGELAEAVPSQQPLDFVGGDRPRRFGFLDVFAEAARQNKDIDQVIAEMPEMQEPLQKLVAERKKMAEEKAAAEAENADAPWTEQTRRGQGFISYLFNMSSGEFTPSFIELKDQPGPPPSKEGIPVWKLPPARQKFYSKWYSSVDDEALDKAWESTSNYQTDIRQQSRTGARPAEKIDKKSITTADFAQAMRDAGVDPKFNPKKKDGYVAPADLGDPRNPKPIEWRGPVQGLGEVKVTRVQHPEGSRPGKLDYIEEVELLSEFPPEGAEFDQFRKTRAEFDEREAALADRKAQRKQAAAQKAAEEAAEAKKYNWESDPIGYREKFPAIAKTQELGETVGERVPACFRS
jgi:hypothetical protein